MSEQNQQPDSTAADAPIAGASFAARLAEVIGDSSIRGFARRAGVSDTFLRQCLAGRTDPTRAKLLKIAAAGSVSVEWLATGSSQTGPDPRRLEAVLESLEAALERQDRPLRPADKARLIRTAYDHYGDVEQTPLTPEQLQELLRSAVPH